MEEDAKESPCRYRYAAALYKTVLLSSLEIQSAADLLLQGEIVAFPTETVYGLGACIFMPEAIQKIFNAKGRPSDNPLIAHISHLSQVETIAQNIPDDFYLLAEAFFPGPLTVVLERTEAVPPIVSGGLDSIALRMPSHPIAMALIEKTGQPIVAPSANISGKPSSTHSRHVIHDFDGKISAIIEGASSEIGIESTVVSLLSDEPIILRPGHITQQQIETVLKKKVAIANAGGGDPEPARSPGMKYRHYAPSASVQLFFSEKALKDHISGCPGVKRLLLSSCNSIEKNCIEYFRLSAKTLYAALRKADEEGYSEILVYCDGDIVQDIALMNRLSRAAEVSC